MRLDGDDWARLGSDAERLARFIGNRAYLRMTGGRCAALAVSIEPESGARGFFCSVYDRRPRVCRDLARGSTECEAEIARKAPAATFALPDGAL